MKHISSFDINQGNKLKENQGFAGTSPYAVNRWPEFAEITGVDDKIIARVRNGQRLKLE